MKDTRFSRILTEGTRGAEPAGHGQSASPGEPRPNGGGRKRPSQQLKTSHTSLYEDTLSRKAESPWRAVALIVVILLAAGGLVAFFAGRSSDTKPLITISDPTREQTLGAETQPAAPAAQTPAVADPAAPAGASTSKSAESTSPPPQDSAPSAADTSKVEASTPAPAVSSRTTREASPQESSIADSETSRQNVSVQPARPKVAEQASSDSGGAPQPDRKVSEPPAPTQVPAAAQTSEGTSTPPSVAESADESDPAAGFPARGSEEYQQLLQNSSVAARLVAGGISTLSFETWRIVQQTDAETWIDLIGRWNSSGDEVHFIWSINRQSGAVRPLSEAARNLEHSDS
jgi:hypothetical protein